MNFCIDALKGHFVQHLAEKTITAFVFSKTLFTLTTTDFETTCGLEAASSLKIWCKDGCEYCYVFV